MSTTLYASRLVGLPVLDPDGATIGHVADAVAASAGPTAPPVVLGFVVAVPGRRIFLNSGRVRSIEADGLRLAGSVVNLRRFQPRPSEVQLVHELLDRRLATGEIINDAALTLSRTRARIWEVSTLDVGRPSGVLRRTVRAKRTAEWQEALPLFPEQDLFSHLREQHPADVAANVHALSSDERDALVASLDDEELADLLEELPEAMQADIINGLALERAADVLEAMSPDDAADLLEVLASDIRRELLEAMEPDGAKPVRHLMTFRNDTAGGLMTSEPLVLPPTARAADALAMLRDPDLPPALAWQVFVTEPPTDPPTGRLLGVCTVQQLLGQRPSALLADCLNPEPRSIGADENELQVAEHLAAYDLIAAPVVDADGNLLGAVTVDDVLDRMLPRDWRAEQARREPGGHA